MNEIDVPNIVEIAHLAAKLRAADKVAASMDGDVRVEDLTYYSRLACDLIEAVALEVHERSPDEGI